MICDELKNEILLLAKRANPAPDQEDELIDGWALYFLITRVPKSEQLEDFRAVMRARALMGSISLVAPRL